MHGRNRYDCPTCAEPLLARYEDELVRLECETEHLWFSFPVPSGAAVGRSVPELLDVTVRRASVNVEQSRNGLCPRCWGVTTLEIAEPDGTYEPLGADWRRVAIECERCWLAYNVPLQLLLARSRPWLRSTTTTD